MFDWQVFEEMFHSKADERYMQGSNSLETLHSRWLRRGIQFRLGECLSDVLFDIGLDVVTLAGTKKRSDICLESIFETKTELRLL